MYTGLAITRRSARSERNAARRRLSSDSAAFRVREKWIVDTGIATSAFARDTYTTRERPTLYGTRSRSLFAHEINFHYLTTIAKKSQYDSNPSRAKSAIYYRYNMFTNLPVVVATQSVITVRILCRNQTRIEAASYREMLGGPVQIGPYGLQRSRSRASPR